MTRETIEQRALAILKGAKSYTIPVPVETVAAAHRIRIRKAPHKSFSGMLIRKDGLALIGVSSSESPVRQRFTVAHELGHFFLHPQKDAFVDYRDNQQAILRTPRERQANMFAAALLMPRDLLQGDCRALSSVTPREVMSLAMRYRVSADAMRFRLENIGVRISTKTS